VAEGNGRLTGACLGLMTYSTWRGARGLYVVDLFVLPEARGRNIGQALLRASARRFAARGAQFIKLEVDEGNSGAGRFYARLGFAKKTEDRLRILEHDEFTSFISSGGET
jgi:ribosomal protein S18 acetylase RimI-like enzyme